MKYLLLYNLKTYNNKSLKYFFNKIIKRLNIKIHAWNKLK